MRNRIQSLLSFAVAATMLVGISGIIPVQQVYADPGDKILSQTGRNFSAWLTPHPIGDSIEVNQYTEWPAGLAADRSFWGGAFDGENIWMAPLEGNQIVKFNKRTGVMKGFDLSAIGGGFNPTRYNFNGAIFDGQSIWFLPASSNPLVRIDKDTEKFTTYNNWPAGISGSNISFSGGVFDGKHLWLTSIYDNSIVKVDTSNGTMTQQKDWPSGATPSSSAFSGAIFDGQSIWLIPGTAASVIKIDKDTGEITEHKDWPTPNAAKPGRFDGGTFDGQNIWLAPITGETLVKIDKASGKMTGYNIWSSARGAMFDGQDIWLISKNFLKIDKDTGKIRSLTLPPAASNPSLQLFDGVRLWVLPSGKKDQLTSIGPKVKIVPDQPLTTLNLNGRKLSLTIPADYAFSSTLNKDGFKLNKAPAGLAVDSVIQTGPTSAELLLSYTGTGKLNAIEDFSVTIAGDQVGQSKPITTDDLAIISPRVPSVITNTYTESLKATSVIIGGKVWMDGGNPVAARGIEYQKSTDSTYTKVEANSTGLGDFAVKLSNLTPNSVYVVRAYATNGVGTEYGYSQTLRTPAGPALTAAAGDAQASLKWKSVTGTVYQQVYQSTVPGTYGEELASVSSSVYSYNAVSLTNGKTYYFVVKITDADGDVVTTNEVSVTPKAPSGGSSGSDHSSNSSGSSSGVYWSSVGASDSGATVLVNGKSERAGTITTSKDGERTILRITLDSGKLEEMLKAAGNHAKITIPATASADTVIGELNGQLVKTLAAKQAVIELKTEHASYTLSTEQINIDALLAQIGGNAAPKDINVQIEISKPAAETTKRVEDSAKKGGFTLLAPPVEFKVRGTFGKQTVEIGKFNAYVERTITIPDGANAGKIATGIRVDADGTVQHVPTKLVNMDGKYIAKINSLANNTYAVIWNPAAFKDAENHWAKKYIDDAGSRLIVNGVSLGTFEPDRPITRAEFAATLSQGLGLQASGSSSPFLDVKKSDWFAGVVAAAYENGILSGYEDGSFQPNKAITREEAMFMMAKAMKITGMDISMSATDAEKELVPFRDANQFGDWSKIQAALSVKHGIIDGYDGLAAPKENITRAQTATILIRLLQKAGLI
ncbi:S-layer homology domain-containing protein [Paenibacillus tyrfis]|uniref:S-layer homology domain-containing protein n=1 Tax=Paenibacillus tyrfis TaxID=1501230 RepID=UPI0006906ED3|nr:S-layer homology domain-containing protein [Paenibacillus tyrfis]